MRDLTNPAVLAESAEAAGESIERLDIEQWATADKGGHLPTESAHAFAVWLNDCWFDWADDGETTVGSLLNGAIVQWCGGRTD